MTDAAGTDATLLHKIEQRDSSALGEIYDRYSRLVYSIALKILHDEGTAEEVTQDVFLLIWEKASSYDPAQGKISTWIASISRNRAIDRYRRLKVRPEGTSITWDDCCEDNPTGDPDVEPRIITSLQRRSLIDAIGNLPPDQKAALSLAFFQGMTHHEIADRLHEPLGTIKTRIRLALLKLRASIEPDHLSL